MKKNVKSNQEEPRHAAGNREHLVQDLSILRQMDDIDAPDLRFEEVCGRLLEIIASGLDVENCSLFEVPQEEADGPLSVRAAFSPLEEKSVTFKRGHEGFSRFKLGEGIMGKVAQKREGVRLDNVANAKDFLPLVESSVEVRSLLCFPLVIDGRAMAVLNLSHSNPSHFDTAAEDTLAAIANRAARILSVQSLHDRLRKSEEHHRLLAQNAGDGILVFRKDYTVSSANPAVADITGAAVEILLSGERTWEDFIHPEDRKEFLANCLLLHRTNEATTVEYRLIDSAGRVRYLEERSSPLVNASGEIDGVISVVRDATDRVEAEEERRQLTAQIQQAQKLESLGVLAGGIAHDFNNLLMGVLGNVDLALLETGKDSPVLSRLEEIESASKRAADLCSQLLAYSGKGKFLVKALNLNEIVEEMSNLLDISVSKKARLNLDLRKNLPALEADATQIRQVVMNLITNASEAMGERTGLVRVKTGVMECDEEFFSQAYMGEESLPGLHVFLRVADNGSGMSEETLSRIFEPFFTTKFTGRGLGLAAVLGIIRAHRGAVQIESKLGEGTTFLVVFPALDRRVAGDRRTDREPLDWRGEGKALLVDDEPIILEVASQMLEHFGFEVVTAEDGREAVEAVRREGGNFKFVLLDLTMPVLSGEEAFEEIHEFAPDLPILLSSGYNEKALNERLLSKGLAGFVHKPYQTRRLVEAVRDALEPQEPPPD